MLRRYAAPLILILTACGPASPLQDRASVKLTGKILAAEGAPFAKGAVSVKTSKNTYPLTTDEAGRFETSLLGFEAKGNFGEVAPIHVSVRQESGQSLSASPRITELLHQLPDMRFWNGLASPQNGDIPQEDVAFKWEAPPDKPDSYKLTLYQGESKFWAQESANPSQTLPLTLFDSDTSYSWQVTASFPHYSATTDKRVFKSSPNAGRKLSITSIRDNKGESYPRLHDGAFGFDLVKIETGKEFIIDLGSSQTFNRLAGHSDDNDTYRLEVFASDTQDNWKRLNSAVVKGSFHIDLKAETARYIRLVAILDNFALVDLSEIRIMQ